MWRQVSGLAQSGKNTFMPLYTTFLYAQHIQKYRHCRDSLQVIAESIAPDAASDAIQPMDGHQSPAPLGAESTDGSPAVLYCSTTVVLVPVQYDTVQYVQYCTVHAPLPVRYWYRDTARDTVIIYIRGGEFGSLRYVIRRFLNLH